MNKIQNQENREELKMPEQGVSLVDHLAGALNCEYVGQLHYLNKQGNERLISLLKGIPTTWFSHWDWNDALNYLVFQPAQETEEKSKSLLLKTLEAKCAEA